MKHALGKNPATGHNLYDTFNEAGRQLFSMNQWSWMHQGPYQLQFVAGEDHVILPDDFGAVIGLYQPNTTIYTVRQVTIQEILYLRQSLTRPNIYTYHIAFGTSVPAENAGLPQQQRALIYPNPTSATSPDIEMVYRRRWRDVSEANANDYPSIDPEVEGLLSLMAQERAYLIENKQPLFPPGLIDAEFARCKQYDGTKQWNYGLLRGGAGDRRLWIDDRPQRPHNAVT